jgi:hypothetical protein
MPAKSVVICENNLSVAWARALSTLMTPGVNEIVPLQVTIELDDGRPIELLGIRNLLDAELRAKKLSLIDTVASTIFPISMWNPALPREKLFERYLSALPSLKKFPQNRNGLYFERFIAYGDKQIRQLEFIIRSRLGENGRSPNRRRSMLQTAVFDPSRDLTNQRQRGFPCLQQVSFAPFGNNELAVHGFYATQYVFQKAYGNYLGLYNLGRFVAHELGLQLRLVTCFSGIAELGTSKMRLTNLKTQVEQCVVQN